MKFKLIAALLTMLMSLFSSSEAAKIDAYRDAMLNKNFTKN